MMKKWKVRMKETRVIMKKNKQFKTLTTKTITIREKMEKMQLAFHKV